MHYCILYFLFSAWDSGAPVIVAGDNPDDDLLVGLGSTGVGCADNVFPSIQARVSAGMDWIQQQVCELSANPPSGFDCIGLNNVTNPPDAKANNTTQQPLTATTTTTITTALYSSSKTASSKTLLKNGGNHQFPATNVTSGSATAFLGTCSLVMLLLIGTVQLFRRNRRVKQVLSQSVSWDHDDEEHNLLNVQLHQQTYDSIEDH